MLASTAWLGLWVRREVWLYWRSTQWDPTVSHLSSISSSKPASPGLVVSPVADGLGWWDATMQRAGLTTPYDGLHPWVRDLVARPV